jgi:prepilin-type processing-associated H-X9-DG protein
MAADLEFRNRRMTRLQVEPKVALLLSGALLALALLISFNARSKSQSDDGVYRIIVGHRLAIGSGSGFKIADPGYVVTNHHVINDGETIVVAYLNDQGEPTGIEADVVWFNQDKDLALLRTREPLPGKILVLADMKPNEIDKASVVTAVGFPGAADQVVNSLASGAWDKVALTRSELDATVSTGTVQRVVSTLHRVVIQHSANINPGNSGGPLFDDCDRVVGVNCFIVSPALSAGDLEFAVHSQDVLGGLDDAMRRMSPSETFSPSVRSGRCRGGYDNVEIAMISATFLLGVGVGLGGIAAARRASGVNRIQPPTAADEFPAVDEDTSLLRTQQRLVGGGTLGLKSRVSGQSIAKISLSSLDGEKGIVLGRAGGGADVDIPDQSVSRRHATIRRSGGRPVLDDLDSTNGTEVDGKRLSKAQGAPLTDGAVIRLGKYELVVSIEEDLGPGPAPTSGMRAGAILLSGFDPQGNAIQHVVNPGGKAAGPAQFKPITSIGRDATNDLRLESTSVSRRHAIIGVDETGTLGILDLGSANGTFVDGHAAGEKPIPVGKAKTVVFGDVTLAVSLLTK